MDRITSEEWYKLNQITVNLYNMTVDTIFDNVFEYLKLLVPYSHSLAYYTLDQKEPGSRFLLKSSDIPETYLNSYVEKYSKLDFINWYTDSCNAEAFRESDLFSDELRKKSVFTQEWMLPLGIFYGACMVIAKNTRQYGAMFVYRSEDEGDFTDKEIEILNIINSHISQRFAQFPHIHAVYDNSSVTGTIFADVILTKRETEIISLIRHGTRKSELCNKLFITKNTLNKHLDNIYKKFKINTFEELLQSITQTNL